MTDLQKKLFAMADEKYADFEAKLAPTIPRENCMGVRVPLLRQFAKDFAESADKEAFLHSLPHRYYDENLLHSILLEKEKPFERALSLVEEFLPYVDNWAACDTLRPGIFKKNKALLLPHIQRWIASKETYTCRFGLDMLMTHYLEEDFKEEYLSWAAGVHSEEYYVNMMVAWFFATALSRQWDAAIPVIEQRLLSPRVHNKTIQKAVESFCITEEQKEYLKALRVAK